MAGINVTNDLFERKDVRESGDIAQGSSEWYKSQHGTATVAASSTETITLQPPKGTVFKFSFYFLSAASNSTSSDVTLYLTDGTTDLLLVNSDSNVSAVRRTFINYKLGATETPTNSDEQGRMLPELYITNENYLRFDIVNNNSGSSWAVDYHISAVRVK